MWTILHYLGPWSPWGAPLAGLATALLLLPAFIAVGFSIGRLLRRK